MAFTSCIGSKIMPIQAFGVFAAIVVTLVYVITICFQPLNYYIYEKTGVIDMCKKKKCRGDEKIENLDESTNHDQVPEKNLEEAPPRKKIKVQDFFDQYVSKFVFKMKYLLCLAIVIILSLNIRNISNL